MPHGRGVGHEERIGGVSETGLIRTVRGDVPAASWGLTNAHAHLSLGMEEQDHSAWGETAERYSDHTISIEDTLPELRDYARAGGTCLVNLTPMGMGRDPTALARASEATGVHIVMGTGIYHEPFHPDRIAGLDELQIARIMIGEITEGVDGTGIRAGIIGEQGTYTGPMTEREATVFRASALAALETGGGGVHPHVPGS